MVSVLVVNGIGYAVAPWGPMLGLRVPADSTVAAITQALVGAMLQGKGYPVLAFVFGMALWLSARSHTGPEALRRGLARNRRLLRLGVVHGVFVYFGDILTLYALVGRGLLRRLHMPWGHLRRHLKLALLWAVLAKLAFMAIGVAFPDTRAEVGAEQLGTAQGPWAFLTLNALAYVFGLVVSLILAAPVLYLCMACGVVAARLRLLTHRRWRGLLRRYLSRCGPPLLVLSVMYGWGCTVTAPSDMLSAWNESLGDLIAIPVAACYVAALALASAQGRARWCAWLSPLGQRTLTLYVGHSLLCLVLLSGAGFAIALTTAQIVLACLGLWALAWLVAACSGTRRWPLEAWMGRR